MKTFVKIMLLGFLALLFMPPAQCFDTSTIDKDQINTVFEYAPEFPVIAQDIHLPTGNDVKASDPSNVPLKNASMNPVDYGFAGVVTLATIGLITWMIKSDKADRKDLRESMQSDRKELISAIEMLRQSIEAQRQSNDRLSTEIHSIVKGFESQINDMKEDMRRLEESFRNEIRRS